MVRYIDHVIFTFRPIVAKLLDAENNIFKLSKN